MKQEIIIESGFPGGNILLEKIEKDDIYLRQDLRDTSTFWFYWAFRVEGAQGRKLTFHFTDGDVVGMRGPAVSFDSGASWQWLGDGVVNREDKSDVHFSYEFMPGQAKVLFAFCPIYTQCNLESFLEHEPKSTFLEKGVLCQSRQGKDVEILRFGNPDSALKVLFTCRHHACEAMASYFLEGILKVLLSEGELGAWYRENVDCAVIPFMDKDGVEAGDQGKNRAPYDHNRDYGGEIKDSIYPEVAALRRWMTDWVRPEGVCIVIDLHCPHIRGDDNKDVYFVGVPQEEVWQEAQELSRIWEGMPAGLIPFKQRHNIPYGQKWNVGGNYGEGKSFTKWAADQKGVHLAAAMELPYAEATGVEVTPERYHELGQSLAAAIRVYSERKIAL